MLSEVPQKVRELLRLPDSDQGIDIVAKTKTGKYWAIQCKYRGSNVHSLTWREISTFTGLTFGICKNFDFGLIAYTGERYTKVLNTAEHIAFLSSDTWSTLDAEFFKKLSKALTGKKDDLKPRAPRPHQKRAIEKAKEYFADKKNTRGKLIMPCGTGKSLTGFWIAEELGAKTVIVAVPSLSLIQQTLPVWLREYAARGEKNMQWLCVCSDQTVTANTDSVIVHTQDLGYPCLTNKEEIKAWLKETAKASPRVIFTTYQSGKVIADALRESKTKVDLGIMDEAHKTVGQKDKLFSHLLFDENLPIERRVFMTATERRYAGKGDEVISMDDPKVYGDTFELLSFKEALEQNPPILADYKVITMVISQKELAKLIADNRYVRPTGAMWSEEVEAQMLASLIAYRKAAQKHPIKHAVSFHSSIARAQAFRDFNDTYSQTKGEELETFHVTGAMPSAVRKQIVSDFAKTDRALITNARCLTEGVDVPNIDCVIFADPKQSTIDIVQAVGRALRPFDGKDYGYILVPVIAEDDDPEEFIGSEAFASVMTVLRALGANDERIIEHFRSIHGGRRLKGGIVEIDMDEKVSVSVSLEKFAEEIETHVWSRLARLAWRPYEEARVYVRALALKDSNDWLAYIRGKRTDLPPKPFDIPGKPHRVYGPEFVQRGGMSAWLGSGRRVKGWRSFEEANAFAISLGLRTGDDWDAYCRGERPDLPPKPDDIPVRPEAVYRDKFQSMGKWLGSGIIANHERSWRSFDESLPFVHKLGLKNQTEWRAYCKGFRKDLPKKPDDIPSSPTSIYKDFTVRGGWGKWLNTESRRGGWRPYSEAVKFVHSLGLKSSDEWQAYCKGMMPNLPTKPLDIPSGMRRVYAKEFEKNGGMGAWLGTGRVHTREWRSYDDAIKFVHKLGIKNEHEWRQYSKGLLKKSSPKPLDIPSTPATVYGKEFYEKGGFGAWLGTKNRKGGWRPYKEARSFVSSLGLNNLKDWEDYCNGKLTNLPPKPVDIPRAVHRIYGKDFSQGGGMSAWLGKNSMPNRAKKSGGVSKVKSAQRAR